MPSTWESFDAFYARTYADDLARDEAGEWDELHDLMAEIPSRTGKESDEC
ncbi:hypothetical protein [Actinopolymorpha pittospori]|uniref:Uncharacterized protein n=1 Tax=Actinopolymorpha pittospori TaxID=648752 RepID=A0A927MTB7_9ACTN|nr:hypothetical protein [Actinopolymorpha pittospori]MBE1606264.1 hypothetical protein [Actinopolymorpha pittospori]